MQHGSLSQSGLSSMVAGFKQNESVAQLSTEDKEGYVSVSCMYPDGRQAWPAKLSLCLLSASAQKQIMAIITKDFQEYQIKGEVASVLQPRR